MLQRSILCMQGTQYATKRSILCRGAFCGPTLPLRTDKRDGVGMCWVRIDLNMSC